MLDSSPKLQSLTLDSFSREDCPVGWEWNQPKCVPECLLLHLETLVWTCYYWRREDHKQVATYILKNARQLKKATFCATYITPKELEKLEIPMNSGTFTAVSANGKFSTNNLDSFLESLLNPPSLG